MMATLPPQSGPLQAAPLPAGPVPTQSASGHSLLPLAAEERERRAATLTADERRVLLDHGTERPFCGGLLDNKQHGTYLCRLCDLPLFSSSAKFDSGTGWPSFFAPFDPHHIRYIKDMSHGMVRIEIRCQRCDSHLGHVFPDGPATDLDVESAGARLERARPSGWRYCLNSVAMRFVPD